MTNDAAYSRDLEDKVRSRIAEIMSAAGVPHSQIALEVLYFLPADFVNKYGILFSKALKADGGESNRNAQQQDAAKVARVPAQGPGTAASGQKRYKKSFVIMDEKALDLKGKLDKRLRGMAREIDQHLAGLDMGAKKALQCGNCGMFCQSRWSYCPACGTGITGQTS